MSAKNDGLRASLSAEKDAAGLAAFRILFGSLMLLATVRFAAKGWIGDLYLDPSYHFTYLGFDWVRPWPAWGMALHFVVMGAAALFLAIGMRTRLAAAVLFLTFTYAELIDKTAYLNHYYLVSLIAFLWMVVPSGKDTPKVGAWVYLILRGQVAVVYLFAGLAKLNPDWLFRAQPLHAWLQAFRDLPLFGPLLSATPTAFAMSWAGAAFDLSIVPLLLHARTRPYAYGASVVFHGFIWLLFPIGMFSWIMLASATLFFDPGWPRRLFTRLPAPAASPSPGRSSRAGLAFTGVYLLGQILLPLRFLLYPGNPCWTEEAFRFSWRVMLTEKTGEVKLEVTTDQPEARFLVKPRDELTPLQVKMMSTQPDMIQQYALSLRERFERRGYRGVHVRAQSWAALNGRPHQRLIDPEVDLAAQPRTLLPQAFIVPLELESGSQVVQAGPRGP